MVEKICKVASEDPERNESDLDLVLFGDPDPECLAIAEKYGYYAPRAVTDLKVAVGYISYSEVRSIFKHGTTELKKRIVKFLFPIGGIPQSSNFNCNAAAIYDFFLEVNPRDRDLAKEKKYFCAFDSDENVFDYFDFDWEDFQYTYLYKKLNQLELI